MSETVSAERSPAGGAPAERPLAQLEAEITAAAVRLAAATAAWLRLIAEFDRREGWAGVGIASCAHWLSWQCGLAPGTAREHVRVARALTALPRIEAAFAAGRLSFSKVRALTRVADEHCEGDLVDFALHATASQVERTVRQWRRADAAADTAELASRQQFDWFWDEVGMLVVRARLTPEDGAAFLAGIESRAERDARRERAATKKAVEQKAARVGARRTGAGQTDATGVTQLRTGDPGLCDADEARAIAEASERTTARRCAALAALATEAADADRRPGDPPRREVVLHVDAAVLAADTAAGRAYLDGGPALTRAQALRLACDATAVTMLEDGGEPLAVGRRRRRATRAQRRALLRRDGGCARPGCPETRIERLHAHHLRHWLFGGRTDLTNLVLLCDRDHGLVHDRDLLMSRRHGRLVALSPDGQRVWGPADTAFTRGLTGLTGPAGHQHDETGGLATVTTLLGPALSRPDGPELPDTLATGGERMDMAYAVGVLMTNRDLTRRLAEQNGLELMAA
jgi:hypothetical protein